MKLVKCFETFTWGSVKDYPLTKLSVVTDVYYLIVNHASYAYEID